MLVAGGVIFVFPAQENYLETVTKRKWNLSRTLAPHNSTFYGTYMEPGSWFQLNISSSSSVRVIVSTVKHDPDPTKIPYFEHTGTSFNQKLPAGGTNFIDIENENPFPVTLQGNVLMQHGEEKYRTIYPYVIPGFLLVLGGTGALIFGVFKKPRGPSKFKGAHRKKKN